MNEQDSLFVIQILLAIIVVIVSYAGFMARGWVNTINKDQREQWYYINKSRVDIGKLQGPGSADS